MTLRALAWWSGGVWAGVGFSLVMLYVAVEVFGQPYRPWRDRLRQIVRSLPFLAPFALLVVIGWPIVFLIFFCEVRRESILERACCGSPPPTTEPVTEKEWLQGSDPAMLLRRLGERISTRKHRLFACACCRAVWDRFTDDRSRRAVMVAERLADGLASEEEAQRAATEAAGAAALIMAGGDLEAGAAAKACQDCLVPDGASAAVRTSVSTYSRRRWERRRQRELLHEIVGNPFQPLPPRDFPSEVVELARACYEGDHALYPLLADALAELGADQAASHCREGRHLKGCHVVDWVLGWA